MSTCIQGTNKKFVDVKSRACLFRKQIKFVITVMLTSSITVTIPPDLGNKDCLPIIIGNGAKVMSFVAVSEYHLEICTI